MNRTQHVLLLTMEECAEVAHRCSKAMRFGLDDVEDGQTSTAAQRLAAELTDLFTVIRILESETGLSLFDPSIDDVRAKRDKVTKHMELSRERGQLID